MASITAPSDYTGLYTIAINSKNSDAVQACIDDVETQILCELFGVDFKDIVLAGVVAEDPIYEQLYNPFNYQDSCNKVWTSKGVKEMLKGFVYFKWHSMNQTTATINGIRNVDAENSSPASSIQSNTEARYNEAIQTYRAIQAYTIEHLDIYSEFKGVYKRLTSWF